MKKRLLLLSLFVLTLSVASGCSRRTSSECDPCEQCETCEVCESCKHPNQRVNVLFTNDVHCGFETNKDSKTMGIAGVKVYKEYLESIYGEDKVSLIDCGDFMQGEQIAMFSNGEYPLEIMNYLGYDLATPGNHDFDFSVDRLIGENGLISKAKFPFISCNFKTAADNKQVLDAYKMIDYGEIKVAYIGITTPATLKASSKPLSFLGEDGEYKYTFDGGNSNDTLVATVQGTIDSAKAAGADYIIGLSHLGIATEAAPFTSYEIIAKTAGFDIVLDGHSHSVLEKIDVKDKNGNNVRVTSTGTKLENIGLLQIDTNGTDDKKDDIILTTHIDYDDVESLLDSKSAKDTMTYLEGFSVELNDVLKTKIGQAEVGVSIYDNNGVRIVRNRNSVVASIVTDAYLTASGADIALVNAGGVRDSIPQGDITNEIAFKVQPFQNELTVVKATGQEIADALEFGARSATKEIYYVDDTNITLANGENPAMLHSAGLKYSIDVNIASTVVLDENQNFARVDGARRVKDIVVLDKESGQYVPIDLEKEYLLITSDFIISAGGDGCNMFIDNEVVYDKLITDSQAFINYITETLEGTISQSYVDSIGERITFIGRE